MVHNPCQSFSTAGHRGSINDPRGRIFLDFVRIVDQIGPRLFVMENVRGLKSAALQHRPLNERGDCYPPRSETLTLADPWMFLDANYI